MEIASEYEEQVMFVRYLEIMGHKHTAIPNNTYTKSWKQKVKNKQSGLKAGLPDLFIIVNNHALFIEMKKTKGGVVSASQKEWIKAINQTEIKAYVAKGAVEAIKIIKEYEK